MIKDRDKRAVEVLLRKLETIEREGGYGEIVLTVQKSWVTYATTKTGEKIKADADVG